MTLPPEKPAAPTGAQRSRGALFASASMVAVRLAAALASFVSVPLVIGHIGAEGYGVWLALLALVGLLNFIDGGIGNGLLNDIAAQRARGELRNPTSTSSAFVLLLTVGGIALAASLVWVFSGGIRSWLGVGESLSSGQVEVGAALVLLLFCLNLPLGVANSVLLGLQRAHLANFAQLAGILIGLSTLWALVAFRAPFPLVVGALYLGTLTATLIAFIWAFWREVPGLRPSLRAADRSCMRGLVLRGTQFLYLQFAAAAILHLPMVLLARNLGAEGAAEFGAGTRLFATLLALAGAFLVPLWPAFREAALNKDQVWIRRTLRTYTCALLAFGLAAGATLTALAGPLSTYWLRNVIQLDWKMLAGFGVLLVAQLSISPTVMRMNAAERLRPQMIGSAAQIVATLALVPLIAQFGQPWQIPFALAAAFLLTHVIPFALLRPLR